MIPTRPYAKKQAKAINRRRLNAQERHQRQQRQTQRDIEALRQALDDLGLPANLVIEIAGRLRAQKKRLGTIFGLMFPTLFACRSADELPCVRGWDKPRPSRILRALPKRSRLKRLCTLEPGCPGPPLASRRVDESGDKRSLAMDVSVGGLGVAQRRPDLARVSHWDSGQHKRNIVPNRYGWCPSIYVINRVRIREQLLHLIQCIQECRWDTIAQ